MLRGILMLAVFFFTWGCATRPVDRTPWTAAPDPDFVWFQTEPSAASHLLRHSVRLRVPARNLEMGFDGVMRLNACTRTARVVALGGFGIKLFDLEVGPDSLHLHFLHPSASRIAHLPERVAFCVRRIWLGFGPRPEDALIRAGDVTRTYGHHDGVFLEHEFMGKLRTESKALGPREFWKIVFTPGVAAGEEAGLIVFTDEDMELTVRLTERRVMQSGG